MKKQTSGIKSVVTKIATISFIIFSLAFQIAKAQNNNDNDDDDDDLKPMIGIKAGANFSNFIYSNDEVTDKNMLVSPLAGIFVKAPITKYFAIQPELLWTNRGSEVSYKFGSGFLTPGAGSVKFALSYIQLPVLAVFNISKYVNIHAGPYFSYLIRAHLSNESQNPDFNSYNELNTGDFQKIDYGLSGGIGFDVRPLIFGIRYDYGLKTINNSTTSDRIAKDARNSAFNIYVGIGF